MNTRKRILKTRGKKRSLKSRRLKRSLGAQHWILVALLIVMSLTATLNAQAAFLDQKGSADGSSQGSESVFRSLFATDIPRAQAVVKKPAPVATADGRFYTVTVTAYNSEVGQTDASPFTTANGTHVRDGIVASNMFPFHTKLKIPSLYGDKIFVVEDRMNSRFHNYVDVWMESKAEAMALGRRTVKIEVIK